MHASDEEGSRASERERERTKRGEEGTRRASGRGAAAETLEWEIIKMAARATYSTSYSSATAAYSYASIPPLRSTDTPPRAETARRTAARYHATMDYRHASNLAFNFLTIHRFFPLSPSCNSPRRAEAFSETKRSSAFLFEKPAKTEEFYCRGARGNCWPRSRYTRSIAFKSL